MLLILPPLLEATRTTPREIGHIIENNFQHYI